MLWCINSGTPRLGGGGEEGAGGLTCRTGAPPLVPFRELQTPRKFRPTHRMSCRHKQGQGKGGQHRKGTRSKYATATATHRTPGWVQWWEKGDNIPTPVHNTGQGTRAAWAAWASHAQHRTWGRGASSWSSWLKRDRSLSALYSFEAKTEELP